MGSESGTTRRSLLGRGAVFIGGLAGVVGLAGAAERTRATVLPAGSRAAPGAGIFELQGVNWHLLGQDLKRGASPQRGDRVSLYGVFSQTPGGRSVGEFHATSMYLDTPYGMGSHPAAVMQIHNFQLEEGTLVGVGAAAVGAEGVFTIVGGSGRYLGATGSYVATQDPYETGGDGTARFKFNLVLREGTDGSR